MNREAKELAVCRCLPFEKEVGRMIDSKLEAYQISSSTTIRTSVLYMSEVVACIENASSSIVYYW